MAKINLITKSTNAVFVNINLRPIMSILAEKADAAQNPERPDEPDHPAKAGIHPARSATMPPTLIMTMNCTPTTNVETASAITYLSW